MESDLAISRNVNMKLVERLVFTELKCWANEQYSRRECQQIFSVHESIGDPFVEHNLTQKTLSPVIF